MRRCRKPTLTLWHADSEHVNAGDVVGVPEVQAVLQS